MKQHIKILLFAGIFLVAAGGAFLIMHFMQEEVADPTPPPNNPGGEVVKNFIDRTAGDIIEVFIVNAESGESGYHISLSSTSDFFIMQINERVPEEERQAIPYNQAAFVELVRLIANLSAATLVEEDAQDLAQYGLTVDDHTARIGVTFKDRSRVAFLLGNPTPVGAEFYFRMSDSFDIYTVRLHDVMPLLAGELHWLNRNAFPQIDPNTVLERVAIQRVDWIEAGTASMVIEPIPASIDDDDIPVNRHRLTSPVAIEICPEASVPVLHGLFGLNASEVVAISPTAEQLEEFGLAGEGTRLTCRVEVRTATETYILNIGRFEMNSAGENVGWFGQSSHVPGLVFRFDPATLPWISVTVDRLLPDAVLQLFIYSLDSLTIETAGDDPRTLNFRITGNNESNRIYFNDELLEGTIRQPESDRARFGSLYMYLISSITEELFIDPLPEGSQLIARITYRFREENREDNVVEFYTSDMFTRSIVRLNGTNLFTVRTDYTNRLVLNIEAFEDGGEIVNDF
jgi:hypothetical protein